MKCVEVRVWMVRKGIKPGVIIKGYGVSAQFLNEFLKGNATSKPLAEYFIDKGCPKQHFQKGKVAA